MKTIKWRCETGFAGCVHTGEVEVDDNASEAEIDDYVREEIFNLIEWSWNIVK